jgi:3-methyladenine DNA glycosylase AlkD
MAKTINKKTAAKKTASKPAARKKAATPPAEKVAASAELTAKRFIQQLYTYRSAVELKKYERFFKFSEERPLKDDVFIGVRMGQVFELAKAFINMEPKEIEQLMESEIHEVRAGGMSIMGKQASQKKVSPERLQELYELYIGRHDRINSWDFVDLAAHQVVGRYLKDKPRAILYKLARSKNMHERRTAMVSTAHFIRHKEVEDAFKIAEILVHDKEETVQRAVGWMLRYADGVDRKRMLAFLDKYAATMSRIALRACIEHFTPKQREHYLKLKN